MLKIAIYDRYLSTAGGGERYSCKMAEILSGQPGYKVDLVTDLYADLGGVAGRLNLDLSRVNLKLFGYISDDYTKKLTAGYDLFINATYLSALCAYAGKNIYLCYFPTPFDVDFKFIHRFLLIFFRLPALWMFKLAGKLTGGFSSVEVEEGLYEPKRFMLRRGSWTGGRAVLNMQAAGMLSLGVKNPSNSALESMDVRVVISENSEDPYYLQPGAGGNNRPGGEGRAGTVKESNGKDKDRAGRVHKYAAALKRGQRKKIRIPLASAAGMDSRDKKYRVEITSDTFRPAEDGSGSRDSRDLGAVIYDETAVNPIKKLILKILGYIPLFLITYPRHNSFLDTYQRIISISEYSSFWIKEYWKKDSTILFPPVDTESFNGGGKNKKQKAILSVGRFFPEHHNKKQYELAATFIKMIEKYPEDLKGYTLYLVGGVSDIAGHQEYVESIRRLSAGYPIEVLANVSFERLAGLFRKASVFWHASGLGEDENAHPEKFEHFGITTVEAMSAGCIPVVINKGGQKEIITEGIDGFFFDDLQGLSDISLKIIRGEVDSKRIRENAIKNCRKFSNSYFAQKLLLIIEEIINT